ncbi:response regulator, partial [bacterium]|nr:response regulator [bacterium]
NELTEEGYDVITSGNGSQRIELIEQKRPDLIVLDIRLGKNNGLDLLQDIRSTYGEWWRRYNWGNKFVLTIQAKILK